jgi:tetratricopeptide (TPR) repeat protein
MSTNARSIVFFTTRTSGTNSSWRILGMVNDHAKRQGLPVRDMVQMANEVKKGEVSKGFDWHNLPPQGHLFLHQMIERVNPAPLAAGKGPRFLVNFRDPRDLTCNQYFWQDGHRRPDETEGEFQDRLAVIHDMGIDKWIVSRLPKDALDTNNYVADYLDQVDLIPESDRVMLGYARLCLDLDSWAERVADVFGVKLTKELKADLEPERVANLSNNDRWVGHTWVGADTLPGRYKRDVKPNTIALMNLAFEGSLRRMAAMDPEHAHLYLEGLPKETTAAYRKTEEVGTLGRKGRKLMLAEQYAAAEEKLNAALALDPKNDELTKILDLTKARAARAAKNANDSQQTKDARAVKDAKELKRIAEDLARLRREGRNLLHAGDYPGADQMFKAALALDPGNADIKDQLEVSKVRAARQKREVAKMAKAGKDLVHAGDYAAADVKLKAALALDPESADIKALLELSRVRAARVIREAAKAKASKAA